MGITRSGVEWSEYRGLLSRGIAAVLFGALVVFMVSITNMMPYVLILLNVQGAVSDGGFQAGVKRFRECTVYFNQDRLEWLNSMATTLEYARVALLYLVFGMGLLSILAAFLGHWAIRWSNRLISLVYIYSIVLLIASGTLVVTVKNQIDQFYLVDCG